jgi:Nucleotidyltransferase/DNA polymerase involved in DNA repair
MKDDRYRKNSIKENAGGIVMYVDMNSFFASCEQQLDPLLRGKPVGVCPYESPNAAVIAVSLEAKAMGIVTGMRLMECRQLCPQLIIRPSQPVKYRHFHIKIINVLKKYCNDVIPKSIDEAVLNFTSYKLVYKDFVAIAREIKNDIKKEADYLKCSIGIAPNAFLAKLATDLQKPDGLVEITADNIDEHLKKLQLTDLPGIASGNERRLKKVGIYTPLELRYASISLLRKAFGGIVGYYWHCRLHFYEVDLYMNKTKSMGAGRTVSAEQSASPQTLDALVISLCTRLEQRMVKQSVFCKQAVFFVGYKNRGDWKVLFHFANPLQDAIELRTYIMQRIREYETACPSASVLTKDILSINITVYDFISEKIIQYNLFDNRIQQDKLRKIMYLIKNKYGKNSVRKACETIEPGVMKDAIGFGSVKELNADDDGEGVNNFLLEE